MDYIISHMTIHVPPDLVNEVKLHECIVAITIKFCSSSFCSFY